MTGEAVTRRRYRDVSMVVVRPTPEQVLSLAPDRAAAAAGTSAADPAAWSAAGHDDEAVWGRYVATSAEPYEVAVDLGGPAYRCSCPSRKVPCKHALGLLLLHAQERVVPAPRLPFVQQWMHRRDQHPASRGAGAPAPEAAGEEVSPAGTTGAGRRTRPTTGQGPQQRRVERAERMRAGLVELDRWLADRVRAGLAAGELADPATWDRVAARLVDAQCGGLANRVRRVAARVGQHSRWHEDVLEELAVLHALAQGAMRTSTLPEALADGVHAATGLTVTKDDVLAGVPSTARWSVAGESRTREDRITVRRTWLCHQAPGDGARGGEPLTTWAMLLDFGTVGNELVSEHRMGTSLHADVHWYPGATPLRALLGRVHEPPVAAATPLAHSVAGGVADAGWAMAREPWLERAPVLVAARPVPTGDGRWLLADGSGAVPVVPGFWRLAELVAMSGGRPVTVMGELSADGVLPLTVWSDGQAVRL